MKSDSLNPQSRQLQNLRRILWTIFGGIATITVLCGVLAVPAYHFMTGLPQLAPPPSSPPSMLIPVLVMTGSIALIGVLGVTCLAIYYILKYRLEKDDGLFP